MFPLGLTDVRITSVGWRLQARWTLLRVFRQLFWTLNPILISALLWQQFCRPVGLVYREISFKRLIKKSNLQCIRKYILALVLTLLEYIGNGTLTTITLWRRTNVTKKKRIDRLRISFDLDSRNWSILLLFIVIILVFILLFIEECLRSVEWVVLSYYRIVVSYLLLLFMMMESWW